MFSYHILSAVYFYLLELLLNIMSAFFAVEVVFFLSALFVCVSTSFFLDVENCFVTMYFV